MLLSIFCLGLSKLHVLTQESANSKGDEFIVSVSLRCTHTYSDIHRLPWRDNMSRQCGEGKSGGAVLLDIYVLHLHLFWRQSAGSRIRMI